MSLPPLACCVLRCPSTTISKSPATTTLEPLETLEPWNTQQTQPANINCTTAPIFHTYTILRRLKVNFYRLATTHCFTAINLQTATMASSSNFDAQASTNYKEAFSLFDKRGNGRVTLDNLGDLLRACGQNPTMNEIRELEKSVGGDCECLLPPQPPCLHPTSTTSRPKTPTARSTQSTTCERTSHHLSD